MNNEQNQSKLVGFVVEKNNPACLLRWSHQSAEMERAGGKG